MLKKHFILLYTELQNNEEQSLYAEFKNFSNGRNQVSYSASASLWIKK